MQVDARRRRTRESSTRRPSDVIAMLLHERPAPARRAPTRTIVRGPRVISSRASSARTSPVALERAPEVAVGDDARRAHRSRRRTRRHAEPLRRHLDQHVARARRLRQRPAARRRVCMRSSTRTSRRPSAPPGWRSAKSASVRSRAPRAAPPASASPSAIIAVVLAIGARPSGQRFLRRRSTSSDDVGGARERRAGAAA